MRSVRGLDGLNGGGLGGIYSLQPLPSHWLTLMSMGTPDSPVVHRTLHCSLFGACHVTRPLGFGAVDHWSSLSSCGTEQSGGTPDSPVRSDFADWLWLLMVRLYCSRPWRSWLLLRWRTGQSGSTSDSPVNYSGWALEKTRERTVHKGCSLGHRTVSGAHRTVSGVP
jgi:hypothetical protein